MGKIRFQILIAAATLGAGWTSANAQMRDDVLTTNCASAQVLDSRRCQTATPADCDRCTQLPVNVLSTAYAAYISVKRCYEARTGYQVGYITAEEMAQARGAVRQIDRVVTPQLEPRTTADSIWSRAEQTEGRHFHPSREFSEGTRLLCQYRLSQILQLLREQLSESGKMENGF